MLYRQRKSNFLIWNIIYRSIWIYKLYHKLYVIKSHKKKTLFQTCDIYAGHGSFMLFTKAFVLNYPELHYPTFMYGEEIYMAELIKKSQLKVRYTPTLHIANTGNISTGLIHQDRKSKWSKESLNTIRKMFFIA